MVSLMVFPYGVSGGLYHPDLSRLERATSIAPMQCVKPWPLGKSLRPRELSRLAQQLKQLYDEARNFLMISNLLKRALRLGRPFKVWLLTVGIFNDMEPEKSPQLLGKPGFFSK